MRPMTANQRSSEERGFHVNWIQEWGLEQEEEENMHHIQPSKKVQLSFDGSNFAQLKENIIKII